MIKGINRSDGANGLNWFASLTIGMMEYGNIGSVGIEDQMFLADLTASLPASLAPNKA